MYEDGLDKIINEILDINGVQDGEEFTIVIHGNKGQSGMSFIPNANIDNEEKQSIEQDFSFENNIDPNDLNGVNLEKGINADRFSQLINDNEVIDSNSIGFEDEEYDKLIESLLNVYTRAILDSDGCPNCVKELLDEFGENLLDSVLGEEEE